MSAENISQAISEEFKIDSSKQIILRLMKTIKTTTSEVIHKDKEVSDIIKSVVTSMIEEVRTNLNILDETRKTILSKFEDAKGLDQSKEVKLLEQYVIDIKNTKDWVVVANKINAILKIIKAPSFADNFRLLTYAKEVSSQIRTQNDSIRTMNEVMKRLESQTKETKVSTIQSMQVSLESLKELEKSGFIKILPDYFTEVKSDEEEKEV